MDCTRVARKERKQLEFKLVMKLSDRHPRLGSRLGVAARFTNAAGTTAGELPLHSPYHRRQRVVFAFLFDSFVECCPLFVGPLLFLVGQASLLLEVSFLLQLDA